MLINGGEEGFALAVPLGVIPMLAKKNRAKQPIFKLKSRETKESATHTLMEYLLPEQV